MLTARTFRSSVIVLLLAVTAAACGDDAASMDSYGGNAGNPGRGGATPENVPATSATTVGAIVENDFVDAKSAPLSTFGADVDTASYSMARASILAGTRPSPTTIRVEEFVNYFGWGYAAPTTDAFAVHLEGAPSPFGEGRQLLRIGIQGKVIDEAQRADANLVFLVDTSGSMQAENKLPLVKKSLALLLERLRPTDTLAIAAYAGEAGTLLAPTKVSDKTAILNAIERLGAGGSTAGEAGLRLAYSLAEDTKKAGSINRVILCTDGDFNVGLTGDALVALIESYRDKGITLTGLGFGMGHNDGTMEALTNKGNGNYAFIDSEAEASRVLQKKIVGTLQVIAKDVKIQVEFDPALVARYRLVGYENRVLAAEDFKDDKKDSGEIGAGHSVTAFYEIERTEQPGAGPLATVRLRSKAPEGTESAEVTMPFAGSSVHATFGEASSGFRFGAAVVELAEILRDSKHSEGARYDDVLRIARESAPASEADKAELLTLVEKAKALPR